MNGVKKVLLVRNAHSYDFGGGERYSLNLAKLLSDHTINPVIASAHPNIQTHVINDSIKFIKMPWLTHQNFSGLRMLLFPLYIVWQLRLISWYLVCITRHHIDIVHVQSRDDFIAGTIAGRLLKKRVIWTDHADLKYIYQNTAKPFRNPVGKLVRACSSYAQKIIIVSKNELKLIEQSLSSITDERYVVMYNGVLDRKVKPKRLFKNDVTVFAATSRLVSSKGIAELIQASKALKKNRYTTKTILLGTGPEEKQFKNIADDSVVFLGFPDNALEIVSGADIFVHPSYNEGFSISLVEAAMLGKPVITTEVGGNPEIIEDKKTGVLVPPKDSKSLYDAMVSMIAYPRTAQQYGSALRESYEKHFQLDLIVKNQLIAIYNEVK